MDRPELNIENVVSELEQGSERFLDKKFSAKAAEVIEELETRRALDFLDAICVLRMAENQGMNIKSKMHQVRLLITDNLSFEAEDYLKGIVRVLNAYRKLVHTFNFSEQEMPDPFKVVVDRKVQLPTPEQMDFLDRNLFKPYLIPGNLKRQTLVDHFPEFINVKLDLHKEAPEVRWDDQEFYFMALKEDWKDQVIDGKPADIGNALDKIEDALKEKDPKFSVTGLTLNEYLFLNLEYLIQNSFEIKKDILPMDGMYSDNLISAENFQAPNGLVYNTGSKILQESSGPEIKIWQMRELLTGAKSLSSRFAVRIGRGENGK